MAPVPRFLHSRLDSYHFDEPNLSQTFRTAFFDNRSTVDLFTLPNRKRLFPPPKRRWLRPSQYAVFGQGLYLISQPAQNASIVPAQKSEDLCVHQSPRPFRVTLSVHGTHSQALSPIL